MKIYINLIFIFCVSYSCIGQLTVIEKDNAILGFDKDRLERLDNRMHQFVDKGQLAGIQTAIMRDGKLVHMDTYGHADIHSKTQLEDDHIWRIFSMTKPIASVGLMMLYEPVSYTHLTLPTKRIV